MIEPVFIQLAKKIAKNSNVKRAKVSALAFTKSGRLLASACNRRIDGQKGRVSLWTEHAEESLIRKLKRIKAFDRFDEIVILVLRITKKGIAMAKPCAKCRSLIKKCDGVKVIYTDEIGNFIIEK